MTALIAGQGPNEMRTVRDLLARLGISRIKVAADGVAAIGAMADAAPDLLIVDWDITLRDAPSVVAASREKGTNGPRILVTMSAPTPKAVEAVKALQVDSVVAVPFSPRAFLDRVPRLERSAAEPEVASK